VRCFLLSASAFSFTSAAAAADILPLQVTGLCYFGVSILGFHAFGTAVPDNVLLAFAHGSHFWVVSAANLMVVIHVAAAYQGEQQHKNPRALFNT
jgi:hypothetical protein